MELNILAIHDKKLVEDFQKLCDFKPSYYPFPGGLPVSMTRKSFQSFSNFNYRVCDKSNGTRYMLYLTTTDNGKRRIGYLINRSMNIYEVPVDLGVVPHIGSVLDGELIQETNGKWSYLVFDVFATKGSSLKNIANHTKRLNTFVNNKHMAMIKTPFSIEIKKFFELNQFQNFLQYNNSLPYETDGIIFTPCNGYKW